MKNPAMTALTLQRARLLIANPDNWIKGKLSNADETCFCAMGALCHTRDRLPDLRVSTQAFNAAESLLDKQAIRRAGANYVTYNDLESTTHADILSLFDEAIEAADAQAKEQAEEQTAASTLPEATEPTPTPTPAIEPLPIVEQLRSLDRAKNLLQEAQGLLLDANDFLADAETEEFSVSVTTDPAQWQAAIGALNKRMDDLMPKFKAGDRVRLVESKCPESIGALMTIVGPVQGLPGWYSVIADKPLRSASSLIGWFDESYDEKDEGLSTEADVFCTRMEKVESVEDLIKSLAPGADNEIRIMHSETGDWMASFFPVRSCRVYASNPDLLSALVSLRDRVKEFSK